MRDDKLEAFGFVRGLARSAGAFAGAALVTGKELGLYVKNMLAAKEGPSTQAAKEPAQEPAQVPAKSKCKKKTKKKSKKKATKPRPAKKRPARAGATTQRKTAKRREGAK